MPLQGIKSKSLCNNSVQCTSLEKYKNYMIIIVTILKLVTVQFIS